MNNVGTAIPKKAEEFTAADISAIMVTNFESAYHLCQLAYPLMKACGNGSIVFNSSIASAVALPLSCIYSASKGNFSFSLLQVYLIWGLAGLQKVSHKLGLIGRKKD